ncbi:MAG TPA: PQQ-dependent sugar dehydrogenase [Patescibacteria group bacterium]
MFSRVWIFLIAILVFVFGVYGFYHFEFKSKRAKDLPQIPQVTNNKSGSEEPVASDIPRLSVVASNLEIPWALVFLPDNSILFTERPGRVRLIDKDGNLMEQPISTISEVKHIGEGGLLGITIHPDFKENKLIYVYYTYGESGGNTLNRVVSFEFDGKRLQNPRTIVDQIPGASNHNGGRIKFGPDGYLYITTGDAQEPSRSQDKNSKAGKILRVDGEGNPAPGNPFNNEVFSFGHRNPQGITWDKDGGVWVTEHGSSAMDELNKIQSGINYGWPEIRGDQIRDGMVRPQVHSGSDTWAPSGTAFLDGSIYFAGLRGSSLFKYDIQNGQLSRYLNKELGRIREAIVGPDGLLYLTTNNRDGRGVAGEGDDKIIRVNPSKL